MLGLRESVARVARYLGNPPKVLGRWTIAYCPVQVKAKVDLANEDHCGSCGGYREQKLDELVRAKSHQTIIHPKKQ